MPSAWQTRDYVSCTVLAEEAPKPNVITRITPPRAEIAYWETFNPLLFP